MGDLSSCEYGSSVVIKFPGEHFFTSLFLPNDGAIYVNGHLETREKVLNLLSMENRLMIESLLHVARANGNEEATNRISSNLRAFDYAYNKIKNSEKSDDRKDSVLFESYCHY